MHTVRVNRKAAGRIASGHPWIFASDVLDRGEAAAGDTVLVTDPAGKTLGTAHYSDSSQSRCAFYRIALRRWIARSIRDG